jgi:ATP-dependent RNA helicase SUPV3L1/SUV3
MLLPIDGGDSEMMRFFMEYVHQFFIRKEAAISRPLPTGTALYNYEKYYQKLGLYYSFSKNFSIDFEPQWVYKERLKTSEKINALLLKL